MGRIFGTDGARGIAGSELTAELALNIGRAAAMVLAKEKGHKPVVLLGRDTRISGTMLESAVAAGLCSVGADCCILGVVPTPAVSFLTEHLNADAGVMISASHNTFEFNGIKLFGGDGFKLTDAMEEEIEAIVLDTSDYAVKTGGEIGKVFFNSSAVDEYVNYIANYYNGSFKGRILVDTSNGSASVTAEKIFKKIGVNAHVIFHDFDGININHNCGSTHVEVLAKKTVEGKYDMGFAFDGDADRFFAVDEKGNILNGDFVIYMIARYLREHERLNKNAVVVTTMSNLGLLKLLDKSNYLTEITDVGDRYVLENMRKNGYSIGGEQSGHIILLDYLKTGDGELSAIALLNAISYYGGTLSQLAGDLVPYSQVMVNVNANASMKRQLTKDENVSSIIKKWEKEFDGAGRIVVRPSGTENYIRVMIEGEKQEVIEKAAKEIAETISLYLI